MDSKLKEKIKALSKNDRSFNELQHVVDELIDERDCARQHLHMLERVIEYDYDAIVITGLELDQPGPEIVYVNSGFTEITGYERNEAVGKTPRILQGPKTDQKTLDQLKNRLKSGRPFFGQAVNYRKDGSEFINQWDIHPLMNDEGTLTHWVAYMHDISERKRAEQSVINTHATFNDLRKHAKSTLIDVDTDGHIVSANKSFRNLTGYAKDELHGRKIWELFPHKYRNSLKTRFDKAFDAADFSNQVLQGIIKHKKGLPIQVEGLTSVINLKGQTIIRGEIKNISLQKRIMETLKKRREDYAKIVEKVTQFTYRLTLENGAPVIEYLSENFTSVTGLPAQAIIQTGDWEKLIHDDDIKKVRRHLKKVMSGTPQTCEYRIITQEGTYRNVIDYAKPGTCKKDKEERCVRGAVSFLAKEEPA